MKGKWHLIMNTWVLIFNFFCTISSWLHTKMPTIRYIYASQYIVLTIIVMLWLILLILSGYYVYFSVTMPNCMYHIRNYSAFHSTRCSRFDYSSEIFFHCPMDSFCGLFITLGSLHFHDTPVNINTYNPVSSYVLLSQWQMMRCLLLGDVLYNSYHWCHVRSFSADCE